MQTDELSSYSSSDLPEQEKPEIEKIFKGEDQQVIPQELTNEEENHLAPTIDAGPSISAVQDEKQMDIRSAIGKMNLPQKVKLAMFGNGIVRALMIRDTNKLIQNCVLKNPKLQIGEIEDFAKNTNVSENVLRSIGGSGVWMKSYKCKLNLVLNPKTPIDLSLRWIKFITDDHLKLIARSKNVPQIIQLTAKKKVSQKAKKKD